MGHRRQRMNGWLLGAVVAAAASTTAFGQESRGRIVAIEGQIERLKAGDPLPEKLLVPADVKVMAYFAQAKVALLVAGPATLRTLGQGFELQAGLRVFAAAAPPHAGGIKVFAGEADQTLVTIPALPPGETYIRREGSVVDVEFHCAEPSAALELEVGAHHETILAKAPWRRYGGPPPEGTAPSTQLEIIKLGAGLSLQVADRSRSEREQDLLATVTDWDKMSQHGVVESRLKEVAPSARPEIRQSPALTSTANVSALGRPGLPTRAPAGPPSRQRVQTVGGAGAIGRPRLP
jgi:hypothetical protein